MKVFFLSPYNILDQSSGASISCKTMLRMLRDRSNVIVSSIGSTVFDKPQFDNPLTWLQSKGAVPLPTKTPPAKGVIPVGKIIENNIIHWVSGCRSQIRPLMTSNEMDQWWDFARRVLFENKPDLVLGFGGGLLEQLAWRWCHDQGIPVLFYLVNQNYHDLDCFRYVSKIITDTEATAQYYRKALGVEVTPIGKYVDPVVAQDDWPRDCVVMVNPSPEKGVSVFISLVLAMAERRPETRFLVVENRGKLTDAMAQLGVQSLKNIEVMPMQVDMKQVWRRTKLLVHPSLWHESGPRICMEALSAGVPVLATRSGGVAEVLNGGGILFDLPQFEGKAYMTPVTSTYIAPWVDKIDELMSSKKAYATARRKASAAWKSHPIRNNYDQLIDVCTSTIQEHQKIKLQGKNS